MKRKTARRIVCFACSLLLACLSVLSASANSALNYWFGVDAGGVMIREKTCPLEITHERLIFRLNEQPPIHFSDVDEFLGYGNCVSAEYTFYNPADYWVDAVLLFPFGLLPDYAVEANGGASRYGSLDARKYNVYVDGYPVRKQVRYTMGETESSHIGLDPGAVENEYRKDPFFRPDLPVTVYTYRVSGVEAGEKNQVQLVFECKEDSRQNCAFYTEQIMDCADSEDKSFYMADWITKADNGRTFRAYRFGEAGSVSAGIYQDAYESKKKATGQAELVKTETVTFEDFALRGWNDRIDVPKVDYYNAVVQEIQAERGNEPNQTFYQLYSYRDGVLPHLMRWYEYQLSVGPKKKAVNSVNAPIYPGINREYDPAVYEYTYLTSPAKSWKKFGGLEVEIETPYELIQSDPGGFEKKDGKYVMFRDSLPERELKFSLCTVSDPHPVEHRTADEPASETVSTVFFIMAAAVLILAVIGICVWLIIRAVRKSSKNRTGK